MLQSLPLDELARVIPIALFEFSLAIPAFHGHVLKYTGDGLIAYFAEPSFLTKNDLALDCALTCPNSKSASVWTPARQPSSQQVAT